MAAGDDIVHWEHRLEETVLTDENLRETDLEAIIRARRGQGSLRAKIAETTPLALITEQGENRNQREKQWNLPAFSHGFACRGT